jgi:hypothetical protein
MIHRERAIVISCMWTLILQEGGASPFISVLTSFGLFRFVSAVQEIYYKSLGELISIVSTTPKHCHPEPALRRRTGEGPYEAREATRKRSGWSKTTGRDDAVSPRPPSATNP